MSLMTVPPIAPVKTEPKISLRPNWLRAFRGLWLMTWQSQFNLRKLALLAATLVVIPLLAYLTVDEGRTNPYMHWVVDFYLLLLLPLYCLSVCGGMIRDELQADTLGFLITRPMTRAQFFLAKYLCQMVWLQILAFISGSLLLAVGGIRDINGSLAFAPLFFGAQFLEIVAYGALSSFLGLMNQRYMVLGIIYGFVVEVGIGRIPTNINNLSISRHLRSILANNSTVREMYEWSPDGTAFSVMIMLIAAGLFLGAGAATFTLKEYHHSDEMQK